MTVPICKTCVYYLPERAGSLARCKKIGTIDVVHGTTEYSTAISVREHACGHEGILYKREPRLFLKNLKHRVYENRFYIGYVTMYVVYVSTLIWIGGK
jgi:hypothetical protein